MPDTAGERKGSRLVLAIGLLAKSAKILKLFKVAKPLVLFVSMAISAIAYTFAFGSWWLALLFVVLLLIHEMGHVVTMKMKGFDTPTPVFIPFLGAAIFAPKFTDRDTEAFVGFGGPVLGTIGALAVFGLFFLVPRDTPLSYVLLVGSYLGIFLNLFNLLPVSPLDGGRVTQASGKWFKYVGLFLLAVLSIVWRQPVILYIWILVLFELTVVPLRVRAVIMTICWLSMVTLMSLGFGEQHWIINVIDCVLTLPFVVLTVARAFFKNVPDEQEKDTRPELTPREKMRWFALYLGLSIVLIVTMVLQTPFLPTPE
jgi:Zn-dependent protease